jgi:hypothetical protein
MLRPPPRPKKFATNRSKQLAGRHSARVPSCGAMELEVGPCPIYVSPAVLKGFEADEVNPPLRYCDGVTFIPNGCNGVAAYAG